MGSFSMAGTDTSVQFFRDDTTVCRRTPTNNYFKPLDTFTAIPKTWIAQIGECIRGAVIEAMWKVSHIVRQTSSSICLAVPANSNDSTKKAPMRSWCNLTGTENV